MTQAFQGSLLDLDDEVGLGPLGPTVRRTPLSDGAWLDVRPAWVTGSDALFQRLLAGVPWRAERRPMYDRIVDVPRLLSFFDEATIWPDPALDQARDALNRHYNVASSAFRTAGLCLYRDGRDSVAWHGDTIGPARTEDTMIAIISLGAPRTLALRPRPGGPALVRHELGHGDLVVMGGSCQRTWQHAIPKTSRPVGPRISIQLRPRGVR